MQDIFIEKVHLENVRNHSEMEMDFPPNNFTAIVGKNGAGKSTIFKSISMALYGDDGGKKGERLSIADMLPEKNPKNLAIIVDFKIVENDVTDVYQVQLYQNHKKYKNGFYLIKNGVDISGATKTDTYAMIEKLLYPRDVYHNTVYFTQQVKDFFTALTNSDQKDIFDSILSSKVYDSYYKAASDVLTENSTQLMKLTSVKEFSEDRCNVIKDHIAELNQVLETQKSENKQQRAECEAKIDQFNNDIAKSKEELNKLSIYTNLSDQVKASISSIKSKIELINKSIEDGVQQAAKDLVKYIQDKLQKEVDSCKVKITQIKSAYEAKKSGFLSECNALQVTCSKEVEELSDKVRATYTAIGKIKTDLQNKFNTLNGEIIKLRSIYDTSKKEEELRTKQLLFDNAIATLDNDIRGVNGQTSELQIQINNWSTELQRDEDALNSPVAICSKCLQPLQSKEALDLIKSNISRAKVKIDTAKKQIIDLDIKLDQLQKQKSDKVKSKNNELQQIQTQINEIINARNSEEEKLTERGNKLRAEAQQAESQYVALQQQLNSQIESVKKQYQASIDRIKEKINNLSSEESVETSKIKAEFESFKEATQREYNEKKTTIESSVRQQYKTQLEELQNKLQKDEELNKQYDVYLQRSQSLMSKIDVDGAILAREMIRLKELIDWTSPLIATIANLNKELVVHQDKLTSISADIEKVNKEHTMLSFWKQAFSDTGIKSMLIDMAIPYMNESVAEYLDIVAPGIFTVSFDTLSSTKSGQLRDRFSVNVRHNIKGTSSHKKLSGGEKRLVDIACMCALRGLAEKLYGKRIHNIFYDEVLDALDEDVSYIFCQVSKKMTSDRNISIITHKLADNVEIDRCFKL